MQRSIRIGTTVIVVTVLVGGALFGIGGVMKDVSTTETHGTGTNGSNASGTSFRFVEASPHVGLNYSYSSGEHFEGRRQLATNAGVYVTDFNNDNWPDVLAIGGETPALFENTGGAFRRSSSLPSVDHAVNSALFFDYDNDGWEDLLLLGLEGRITLLENRGGSFILRRDAFDVRLDEPIAATAGDYNGDGCTDVFIAQHGNWSDRLPTGFHNYSAPVDGDNGNPNYLFRGNCSVFTRVNGSGVRGTHWSLATSFADLNNDGRLDVHVTNDFNHDLVYVNRGNGTFDRVVLPGKTNRNGMSSEIADVNHDGYLDIFVTNIYYPEWVAKRLGSNDALVDKARGNNLLVNRGNATFVDRAEEYGVAAGGWGWAAAIADLDNDGDRDLVHATQDRSFRTRHINTLFSDQEIELIRSKYPFYQYPALWVRRAETFENVSASAVGFDRIDSRGVVNLDYDRDGDLDLLFATTSQYRLYENTGADGNALEVVLTGAERTWPIGTSVSVITDGETRTRIAAGRTDFLSQDTKTMHFGLGNQTNVDLRLTWPDGTTRTISGVRTGQLIVVTPAGINRSVAFSQKNRSRAGS